MTSISVVSGESTTPQKIRDNSNEVGVSGCIFLEWVKALGGVGVGSERWVLSKYLVLTH